MSFRASKHGDYFEEDLMKWTAAGGREMLPVILSDAKGHPNVGVQARALDALGQLHRTVELNEEMAAAILDGIGAEEKYVVAAAIMSATRYGMDGAAPRIAQVLDDTRTVVAPEGYVGLDEAPWRVHGARCPVYVVAIAGLQSLTGEDFGLTSYEEDRARMAEIVKRARAYAAERGWAGPNSGGVQ
jgi:hypothetical protein